MSYLRKQPERQRWKLKIEALTKVTEIMVVEPVHRAVQASGLTKLTCHQRFSLRVRHINTQHTPLLISSTINVCLRHSRPRYPTARYWSPMLLVVVPSRRLPAFQVPAL